MKIETIGQLVNVLTKPIEVDKQILKRNLVSILKDQDKLAYKAKTDFLGLLHEAAQTRLAINDSLTQLAKPQCQRKDPSTKVFNIFDSLIEFIQPQPDALNEIKPILESVGLAA